MNNSNLPLALTMGDPGGIGPEIIIKSIYKLKLTNYVVFGDALVFENIIQSLDIPLKLNCINSLSQAKFDKNILNVFITSKLKSIPKFGKISIASGQASYDAILGSIKLAKQKKLLGVVTAPINKKALNLANISFPGHTEIFSEHSESNDVSMMLCNDSIKTILVTLHCSILEAVEKISVEDEFKAIQHAYIGAKMFGIKDPIIAVAALNPHAGEEGLFGNEEKIIIEPAIQLAKEKGIDARGPFPADTVFMKAKKGQYDIVVAQYHDQGLIPIKYEGIDEGVNITVGIDFIRTSPDHGTAFDIAGKNLASPKSFIKAINTIFLIKK
jgi:4-hydroxythreonine-4-phosphate dehydrogenase